MGDNSKNTEVISGLVISDEVIAAIAVNAAKDVEGVMGFATRTPDILQTVLKIGEDSNKAVRVSASDNDIKLHINIIISNDVKIPTVAAAVQRSIKNAVQSMTGNVVSKVDVTVAGVGIDGDYAE